MSIAASGSVGPILSFRTTATGNTATKKPNPRSAPSTSQAINRQHLRLAAAAWASIPDAIRARWLAYGVAVHKTGWLAFSTEHLIQQTAADSLPLIPAVN